MLRFTIIFLILNSSFALAARNDCADIIYSLSADSEMVVRINENGNLDVDELDADKVVSRNLRDKKNQSVSFKSNFYGGHYLNENERLAKDEVTLVTQADGSKVLNYNKAYEPRNKAYQKMIKETSNAQDLAKLNWINTQRQVVMKNDSSGCFIDQILDTSTATGVENRKFTDVYYDNELCEQLNKLQVEDGIPLDKCTDKLRNVGSEIKKRRDVLETQGKYLNLKRQPTHKNSDSNSKDEVDIFRAAKIVEVCGRYNSRAAAASSSGSSSKKSSSAKN